MGRCAAWGSGGLARAAALIALLAAAVPGVPADGRERLAALYPLDGRRDLTGADLERYPGAGVLWCRRLDGVPQKAAAA